MGAGSEGGDVGDPLDADAADALGADLHGGEAEVAGGEGFVAAGRVAEVAGEPRGDGFAGLPLEGPAGLGLEFAHGEGAADDDGKRGAVVDRAGAEVEFVADIADDFLEHVFEGHDASEVFFGVEDDGEVTAAGAEFFDHDRKFGRELERSDRTDEGLEGGVGAEEGELPEPFADEEEAANFVHAAGADGETAVTADLRGAKIFGDGFVEPEGDDLIAGEHDLLRRGFADAQRLDHEFVNECVARVGVAGAAENVFKLIGAEGMVALGGRSEAGPAEETVGDAIEQPDERKKDVVENEEWGGDPEGDGLGALDGEGLGGEFAENNVEKGDDGKRDREGDRRDGGGIAEAPAREEWLDAVGDVGFADPAQTEAGEGDAELGGREGGVEVLGGLKGEFYAPAPGLLQRAELADADLDEGKLGGTTVYRPFGTTAADD